ncbi:MAG: hypothetical protein AABY13_02710, partial [Nanoarchaeota archaeon]
AVQRLAQKASRHIRLHDKRMHPELRNVLEELAAHVRQLEHVSAREDRQLRTINRIMAKSRR